MLAGSSSGSFFNGGAGKCIFAFTTPHSTLTAPMTLRNCHSTTTLVLLLFVCQLPVQAKPADQSPSYAPVSVSFDAACVAIDWTGFEGLPAFAEANQHNACQVCLSMEAELLAGD